jgi:hypothetical protein
MYEWLLPAKPQSAHTVLPELDCVTLAELDCELVMLWLKLKLPLKLPPQTASSSRSFNSRIVCHSLLGLRIAAQSILGHQGAASFPATPQARL